MTDYFMDRLNVPDRTHKPRQQGITVVMPQIDISQRVLAKYGDYVDAVKLLDAACWAPRDEIIEDIRRYHEHDIDVQIGGAPGEVARMQGRHEKFLDELQDIGISWVEYETHVEKPTVDEMRSEVADLKDRGFTVVGEVGAKWFNEDRTRTDIDRIDVDKTVEQFERYLDAGCDKVYWEGLVVTNLIGKNLDNRAGQKALLEVSETVGTENIIFEIWSPTLKTLHYAIFWGWLVYQFGPSVNIGNVPSQRIPRLESIRRGTTFDMNHPYLRWLNEGKPSEDWWRMNPPTYDVGLEAFQE